MRRFACIALPEIYEEIGRDRDLPPVDGDRRVPLGIVVARLGGSVNTEIDLRGGCRLDAVSREAHRLGVRVGHTIATARSKCSRLRVCVIPEESVRSALERIAEVTMTFGPAVAFDEGQNVVWVDIGGCAHLHGGEQNLVRALDSSVRALGHVCRIAIADGPRIAAAVARYWPDASPCVVPEGEGATAVRSLPMTALGLDDDVVAWLSDLGLRSCGDLQKLPRHALGARLGARTHDVMQMLDGDDRAPLDAWRPPQVPEERIELEWGISSVDALAFVTKTLCDRLSSRLEGRAMAAARIELVLGLDRAICGDSSSTLEMTFPSPVTRADDLHAVVRARLERKTLPGPVLSMTLRAPALERIPSRSLDLLTAEAKSVRALPRLVAELAAHLDPANVGTLELVDTWVPDERTRLVPFGASRASNRKTSQSLVTSALEPSRLVQAFEVPLQTLALIEILARVEAAEWWRRGFKRLDLAAAWTVVGGKCGRIPASRMADDPRADNRVSALETTTQALAWVELASQSDKPTEEVHVAIRGWID
ncbi:MAG TPA: DNA polymerase Y family protein [Polyangiaceae bacterium]|nr:DNA polymerase Y family protein [Polyangiaceae bacterium]